MRVAHEQFAGVLPRVAKQRLPPSGAQDATNAKLLSGDLEAWRQFALEKTLARAAPVQSICLLNGAWLSWGGDVDAARGPIAGDTTFRLYLTGPDVYATPQFTDYALATTGAEPYPVTTRPLGVPNPTLGPHVFGIPASGVIPTSTTGYVITYVNDLGQESAQSTASTQDFGPHSGFVPIFTPTGNGDGNAVDLDGLESGIPSDYHITAVRLYRAATGSTGTAFRFVAEFAIGTLPTTFDDFLVDSQLGDVIPTAPDWDVPPPGLRGLLALPNQTMAGFDGNELCLSATGFPHAWPVSNRYATDTDIVGIANIDTTIVMFTKSFLYVASGIEPSAYTMSKFEVPHAGVSKRSVAYIDGVGVIGATPDGLRIVRGPGQSDLVTRSIFTRQQWQALNPPSILGISHDSVYFMFYDTGLSDGSGGYAVDATQGGFGLVPLSFHASAAYNDPETDELFLVLTTLNEPTSAQLPQAPTAPPVDGVSIFEFDSPDGDGLLVYRYRTRANELAIPAAPLIAMLRAADYTNLVWRIIGDGVTIFEGVITSLAEFTLPDLGQVYNYLEFEFIGTSTVRDAQAAEDVGELK
jgi:hypothetical protein